MQKTLSKMFLGAALASSLSAFANDSAVYTLPVKGIDPLESRVGSDLVKFYGQQASEFMKLIPPARIANDITKDLHAKHNKELLLASNAYTLRFFCSDAEVGIDEASQEAFVSPELLGAICRISLFKGGEGDTLRFNEDGGKAAVIEQLSK